jgi:hypothetical protein
MGYFIETRKGASTAIGGKRESSKAMRVLRYRWVEGGCN